MCKFNLFPIFHKTLKPIIINYKRIKTKTLRLHIYFRHIIFLCFSSQSFITIKLVSFKNLHGNKSNNDENI